MGSFEEKLIRKIHSHRTFLYACFSASKPKSKNRRMENLSRVFQKQTNKQKKNREEIRV